MRDIIYRAALFNAVHYKGKAAKGPVMQKVMGEMQKDYMDGLDGDGGSDSDEE